MDDRTLRVLVLSTFEGSNANVIRDFLFSFNAHSRHRYFYVFDCRVLDDESDFSAFDVILVFWSLYLLGPDLIENVRERIRRAPALKVLFLQDEYRDIWPMNEKMRELGIQVMFTCVAEQDHDTFYSRARIPSLDAVYTVLTGYVPEYLERWRYDPDRPRPIDIGYRSREMPAYLGDLGREKGMIAERFRSICAAHGLVADISVRESERLYGEEWVRFVGDSRCVLGTASGSSVIDFTGEIRRRCLHHLATHPEASYDELRRLYFADVDGKHTIETVSPRVFEAAALRSTMVHHEGRYAGVIEPGRHFVCVKRDYSNVAEVVEQIRDHGHCRALADNAYRDLVASGRYSYREFVREFDRRLDRHVPKTLRRRTISRPLFYARNYRRRGQKLLPWKGGFVVAPAVALPSRWLSTLLAQIPPAKRGRLATGFMANPEELVRKVVFAVRLVARNRSLRTILRVHLQGRGDGPRVPIWQIAYELIKLDLAARAMAGKLGNRQPFRVSIAADPALGAVVLTSDTLDAPTESFPVAVERMLLDGRLRAMVWDHARIGEYLFCEVSPDRWLRIGLGGNGLYRFEALVAAYRRSPRRVGASMVEVLRGAVAS